MSHHVSTVYIKTYTQQLAHVEHLGHMQEATSTDN